MNKQKKLTRKEKTELSRQKADVAKEVQKAGSTKNRLKIYLGLFAAVVGLALYASTINFSYTCDDVTVINSNFIVQKGTRAIGEILRTPYRWGYWTNEDELYRPLPLIMFAIEWELFPDNPLPGHLVNILLYGLSGFLLFYFLNRLFRNNLMISLAATLLFLAHPVHTEVVANIKSRDEILGLLFGIASIMWLIDYFQSGKKRQIILSSISFFLALMSKESALPLLAVMPLTLVVFYNSSVKTALVKTIPVAVAAVAYLSIRAAVLGGIVDTKVIAELDNILVSAPDYLSRLATAIYVLGRYLWLMVYPMHLSMDYSLNEIAILPPTDFRVLISLGIYAVLLAYSFYMIKRKDTTAYGILFYLLTIFISSNLLVTIGTVMAERLLYIPSLGLCIAFAAALQKVFRTGEMETQGSGWPGLMKQNIMPLAVTSAVLVFFVYKTLDRTPVWKDNRALYASAVKDAPNSARAHFAHAAQLRARSYDTTLSEQERSDYLNQAIEEYHNSIRIHPRGQEGYKRLANIYWQRGDTANAWKYNEESFKYSFDADALNLKGVMYFAKGQYREAQDMFQKAVDKEIVFSEGYKNLSICNGIFGDVDSEILNLRYAVEYEKNSANLSTYYSMLAKAYRKKGDLEKAEIYSAKVHAAGK